MIEIVSKAEFAAIAGVSRPTVSQWLREGKIAGDAIVGVGRHARIRVAAALQQLNRTLCSTSARTAAPGWTAMAARSLIRSSKKSSGSGRNNWRSAMPRLRPQRRRALAATPWLMTRGRRSVEPWRRCWQWWTLRSPGWRTRWRRRSQRRRARRCECCGRVGARAGSGRRRRRAPRRRR